MFGSAERPEGRRGRAGRIVLAAVLASGIAGARAMAGPTEAPVAGPAPAAEQAAIERLVVAPCCWRKPVAEEGTEAANEVRAQIAGFLAQGLSREQVLDRLIEHWGERILVTPRTRGFNLVLYALPVVGVAAGLAVIVVLLKKWGSRPSEARAGRVAEETEEGGAEAMPVDESLLRRVEEELAKMD